MKILVKVLGNEKYQRVIIPVFAILLSLIAGAVIIALLGKNPFAAYRNLLQGSGLARKARYAGGKSMFTDFLSFMDYWTPMIFASLSVAVALKAGLFNIGVSGQMLAAGLAASVIVGYGSLSGTIAKPLVVLVACLVGGLAGGLIGWLKYHFRINEVVSSIMINYILEYVVSFLIYTRFLDPVSRQSIPVSEAARLTLKNVQIGGWKCDIPLGILGAFFAAWILWFVFRRTTLGYELKAVGQSPKASRYAGIPVGKNMILAMVISGALAGVAGATYYLGYFASIRPQVLASLGFDAVAVSLLGNSNPVGILCSSFLITVISKGSTYMSSRTGLDAEVASLITGCILLFSACGEYMKYRVIRKQDLLKSSFNQSQVAQKKEEA